MSLALAFQTAWRDLKVGATAVAAYLTKNSAGIQTAVADVGAVVTAVLPSAAPVVTVFDNLEEAIIGKVLALANDAANAPTLSALFADAWPVILSLKTQLSTHPAVVAATTATTTLSATAAAAGPIPPK